MSNLEKLMREINETGRTVSWASNNYLYSNPVYQCSPRLWYSATVFDVGGKKVECSFNGDSEDQVFNQVNFWWDHLINK